MFDELPELECRKCKEVMKPIYKYVDSNNSIQARCSKCGAFIQNMKHTECLEKEQDNEKPTAKQILFIKSFYSSLQMPKTKNRANELIYVLNKVRGDYEL
jgi:hypothetical protein